MESCFEVKELKPQKKQAGLRRLVAHEAETVI